MTETDPRILEQYIDIAAALKQAHDHVNQLLREHPEEHDRMTDLTTALSQATAQIVHILLTSTPPTYA